MMGAGQAHHGRGCLDGSDEGLRRGLHPRFQTVHIDSEHSGLDMAKRR